MKKILIFAFFIFGTQFAFSQSDIKIGYVDSNIILTQLPEAIKAQGELDALITRWRGVLDSLTQVYQKALEDYQKQANTMNDAKKLEAQQNIIQLEQNIMDYRRQKFGDNTGEIYLKQAELLDPVKDKIFVAIEEVAKSENIKFVFDKTGEIILLYADSEFDITYKVLDRLKRGK